MFVYEHLNGHDHLETLGALTPAIGSLVGGIQQLKPDIAANVMTFLGSRYAIPDPVRPSAAAGVTNWIAISAEKFVGFGYQVEGTPTAAQQLRALAPGQIALADVDDAATVAGAKALASGDFHLTVAATDAVKYVAGPGSSLAVLPTGAAAKAEAKEVKTDATMIVIPLVGAGIGLLVGGPVGALVGAGVGIGIDYLRSQQKAA